MRRAIRLVLLVVGLLSVQAGAQAPSLERPDVRARAAIVVEARTGKVLFAKNPDKRLPPASATKIMTAYLLARLVPPAQSIRISPGAAALPGTELGAKPGESFPARDLLYALLLVSGNDASRAVAEHLDGSEAKFAQRMNAEAHTMRLPNTHFANPHGLPDPNHYASARDLAELTRNALRNPDFDTAVRTRAYTVKRPDGRTITLRNTNGLLWTLPGADGVKTGWTQAAGHCFVGSATRNGRRLITVVLNSTDWQADTAALVRYGFAVRPGDSSPVGKQTAKNAPQGTSDQETAEREPGGRDAQAAPGVAGSPKQSIPFRQTAQPGGAVSRPAGQSGTPGGEQSDPGAGRALDKPSGGTFTLPRLPSDLLPDALKEGARGNPNRSIPLLSEEQRNALERTKGRHWVRFENREPPPPRFPRWILWALLTLIGLLLLWWLWRQRKKWMKPIQFRLPFMRRGELRREIRSQNLPEPASVEKPDFTFVAPRLRRRTGPEWMNEVLDSPTRLLEPAVRRQMRALMEVFPEVGLEKIGAILASAKPKNRLVAADLLHKVMPRRAEETLQSLIDDPQTPSDVRAEAIVLLAEIGGDRYERYWLEMLLREGTAGAARALAALARLDETTVSALRHSLTAERPRPKDADAELRLNQLLAHIACILGAHGKIAPAEAEPHLNALSPNHRENILVSDLRGLPSDWGVERLVHCALYGHAYPALTALLECDPEMVRNILDPMMDSLDGPTKTRGTVLRWLLLGEGDSALIKKLADAGDDLANGALQLSLTQKWDAGSQSPETLLAAAQLFSLRLGYTDHARDSLTAVFRTTTALSGEQSALSQQPDLSALSEAYQHPKVYESVQAALHLEDGAGALMAGLARRADDPAFQAEMAFWCDKVPAETRLTLTRALTATAHPDAHAKLAERASDPDPAIRATALRYLRANPNGKHAEPAPRTATPPLAESESLETLDQAA